jgi:prevent-host-death family protein
VRSITATRFKAECLSLMEHVRRTGKPVLITKRGRVVAQLAPPPEDRSAPWRRLRGSVARMGDVLSPVVRDDEIEALR